MTVIASEISDVIQDNMPSSLLELFADLLDYPNEQTAPRLEACLTHLRHHLPEAAGHLTDWHSFVAENDVDVIQELYTHTFDLNPVCPLDIGYYLFGEDYQRGVFLVKLRESQEEVGVETGSELPDHLPVILRWLSRIHGTEVYIDMVSECLLPVLSRMLESLADGANPYRGVLQAISLALQSNLSKGGSDDA